MQFHRPLSSCTCLVIPDDALQWFQWRFYPRQCLSSLKSCFGISFFSTYHWQLWSRLPLNEILIEDEKYKESPQREAYPSTMTSTSMQTIASRNRQKPVKLVHRSIVSSTTSVWTSNSRYWITTCDWSFSSWTKKYIKNRKRRLLLLMR